MVLSQLLSFRDLLNIYQFLATLADDDPHGCLSHAGSLSTRGESHRGGLEFQSPSSRAALGVPDCTWHFFLQHITWIGVASRGFTVVMVQL
jgi:hypothetical protein